MTFAKFFRTAVLQKTCESLQKQMNENGHIVLEKLESIFTLPFISFY